MLKLMIICPVLLGSLIGCAGPASRPVITLMPGPPESFRQTSYTKDAPRTARVGEAIAVSKDFSLVRRFPSCVSLDRPVEIRTENHVFVLPKGRPLRFSGVVRMAGNNLAIYLDAHDDEGLGEMYYLKEDSTLAECMYVRNRPSFPDGVEKITSFSPKFFKVIGKIEPVASSLKLVRSSELVFDGKDDQGIHATFREHDPDDLARVTWTRKWTFPADAGTLRCENLVIQVRHCSARSLDYSISAD